MLKDEAGIQGKELPVTKKALEAEKRRYQELFEFAPVCYLVTDTRGVILEANAAAVALFGVNKQKLLGQSVLLFTTPDSREEMEERMIRLLKRKTKAVDTIALEFKRPDGGIIPASACVRIEHGAKGKAIGLLWIIQDVTERRQAEEALRRSEEFLRRSQEIAHLGSWELDLDSDTLTWSDEVYRIFGLKHRQFGATYEAFLKAVHPDDRQAVDDAYSGSLREGRDTYEIEHRIVRKSTGEIRFVHEKCEHLRDDSGRIIRSIGTVHDITERKQAEKALRQSEERYRRLIELATEGICQVDPDFVVIYVNDRMAQMLGRKVEEVLGHRIYEFTAPEDLADARQRAKNRRQGITENYERKLLRKDGSTLWVLISATPLRDSQGRTIGAFGMFTDITLRKQAEEALKDSEAQLRTFIRQSRDGIIMIDDQGTILEWNDGEEQITGLSRTETIGQLVWEVQWRLMPEARKTAEFIPATKGILFQILNSDTDRKWIIEEEIQRPDGQKRTIESGIFLIRSSSGKALVCVITRDITHRKQAEEAVKASLKQKETLLKEVHHRIKNNLQIVSALLGLQAHRLHEGRSAEVLKEMQDRIKSIALVHEKLYRSDDLHSINMADYVRVLVMSMERSHWTEMRHVTFNMEVPPDMEFDADLSLPCGLIVTELVSNALRHAFPDDREGRVHIKLSRRNDQCSILVEDNGVGFPEGFEFPGSGRTMGLQLVQSLTHQLGGKVEFTQDQGVCFKVIFPCPKMKE